MSSIKFWQAFVNVVLTLCDAGDAVVMFAPYYFNSYMSFQMTGVTDILVGASNPETLHPDVGKIVLPFFFLLEKLVRCLLSIVNYKLVATFFPLLRSSTL